MDCRSLDGLVHAELPRRRTIVLYQGLYKIFQLLEVGELPKARSS